MKKLSLSFLVLYLLASSHFVFAKQDIDWKLGTDLQFIDAVKNDISLPAKDVKGTVQLLFQNEINIYADRVSQRIRKAWYYSDSESIQNYGTDSIHFDELSESLVIYEASILTADGNIIRFDPATAQVIDPDTFQVFTNSKELIIPYSGVEIGAIAMLEYEIISHKKDQETDWSKVIYPQLLYPRKKFELNVHWHDGVVANWSSSSEQVTCEKKDSFLVCKGGDIPAVTTDDNVQWLDELGQIVISETDSWESVIDRAGQAFNTALQDAKGIDLVTRKIIEKAGTIEQKISAIHQFVANKIRYISFSEQGHSVTPHSVAETLVKRYGDCKDKSALLVKLLNNISVQAYPVLVATNRTAPDILKTPSMRYFDHMVVCFSYQGKEKCLDATDSYTNWEASSSWIQGKVALPLISGKMPSVIKRETYRWDQAVKSKITFLSDGGMVETQKRVFNSTYAGWHRRNLAKKNSQERKRWVDSQYKNQISSDAKPVFKFSGIDDINSQVVFSSKTEYATFQDVHKDLSYVEYDGWINYEIDSSLLKNTVYSSLFPGFKLESEYVFDTAQLWSISHMSPELDLKHGYGSMRRTVVQDGKNKLKVMTKIEVPARRVPASDVTLFNKFLKTLKREAKINIRGVALQTGK